MRYHYSTDRAYRVWFDEKGNLMAEHIADHRQFSLMDRQNWRDWHEELPKKYWTPLRKYADSAKDQDPG